jgi:hypothetical protein
MLSMSTFAMAETKSAAPTIVRFATPADRDAIRMFNERLRAGGRTEAMPMADAFLEPVPAEAMPVYKRLMIAVDPDGVHAGMLLHHHRMFIGGKEHRFCWSIMPISEGLVDRAYSLSILKLVNHALSYEPFLISLGVGSEREDWARFVIAMGWKYVAVPFFFLPIRATRMLKGLPHFQSRPSLRWAARISAYSGAGALADVFLNRRRRAKLRDANVVVTIVPNFSEWADETFSRALSDYSITPVRNATALNVTYPAGDERFVRLRVASRADGSDLGWIVVSAAQMENNRHFGSLKIGILVDGFGAAKDVEKLIVTGCDHLARSGVDLIVANWSHHAWRQASKQSGFLSGPSNYFLFISKSADKQFAIENLGGMHLTRGDSDGMVNLRGERRIASN